MDIKEWLGEDNQLGIDIWHNKYQFEGESFEDWLDRISNKNEELKQLIRDKKFLFGGRILSNRGLEKHGKKVTYSNCYVLETDDSIEAIYKTCSDLARTFSYGGGCGVDISKLRAKGMKVNNASKETTGACSFMDTFSQVTSTIGQNGRRGALMLSLDCTHPELIDFINIKTDLNKVTKANISVRVNDDFMKAVENDEDWTLHFEVGNDKMEKVVKAKEVFKLLCKNNWDFAEPGVLYWSKIEDYNLLSKDDEFEYAGVNPCFTGDMKLLTYEGFKTLEELCDTEPLIYSYDGLVSKGKVWCNGEKDTIKLILSNNKEITCTPDHRFMTINGEECEAKNLKNKKIMPKIYKTIKDDELFIKLGFIQGDGQLSRLNSEWHNGIEVNIGIKDGDIRYLFESDEYTIKSCRAIYLQGYNDLLKQLQFSQEILPNRVMPKAYNEWNLNQKANFLQGCFSANGCVNSDKRISYKTTCKEFALELINSLEKDFGITANLTMNKKHMVEFENGEYECRESYDININKYDDILLFAQFIGFYQTYKKIKLNKLIESRVPYVRNIKDNGKRLVYDFKEPRNHWGIIEGYVAHNCAEEPLPNGGSCLLGSINLSAYVNDKTFDICTFKKDIHTIVKAMNDVLDQGLPLHPLQIQRDTVRDYRQIGIGVMGIADMLIKLELKYDTDEAIEICDTIGKVLANESIKVSALLSKEEGCYPKYKTSILDSEFLRNNTNVETYELVKKYGLRNSQLLTIAPTGSISTMIGVSGGIEPIFNLSYTRKTESLHKEGDVYYKVYTPIAKEYMELHGLNEEEELPNFFVTAQTLNPHMRVKMQGVWQKHIDASISSTINLPNEATVEEVEELYMEAWKEGLKGLTIYRDGCARQGILTTTDEKEDEEKELLKRGQWKSLAEDTYYVKRNLIIGCGKLKLFIGWSPSENTIQDVYITKSGSGGCEKNLQCIAILMSSILRIGGDLSMIEKSFAGVSACPSFTRERGKGNHLSDGSYCGMAILKEMKTFLKEIGKEEKVIEKIVEKPNKNNDKKEDFKGNVCPECGEPSLIKTNGCDSCLNCGYSKCS